MEEDVYSFEPANQRCGTALVHIGEGVFACGIETLKHCKPLNNCRWTLFQRGQSGWELLRADEAGRTREPSSLAAFPDGRLFRSANPTLVTNRETYSGPGQRTRSRFGLRHQDCISAQSVPSFSRAAGTRHVKR